MAELVIVLTNPISIDEAGLVGVYRHVKVDDMRRSDARRRYVASILYGNVLDGGFVEGLIGPPPQHPRRFRVAGPEFVSLITATSTAAGQRWGRLELEAVYQSILDSGIVEGTVALVS